MGRETWRRPRRAARRASFCGSLSLFSVQVGSSIFLGGEGEFVCFLRYGAGRTRERHITMSWNIFDGSNGGSVKYCSFRIIF